MQLNFQKREERSPHSQARQRPVSYRDDRELELTNFKHVFEVSSVDLLVHSSLEESILCSEKSSLSSCFDPYQVLLLYVHFHLAEALS